MVAYGRTRQISWFESGRKIESTRHQDGRRVRHFLSGRRHWYRFRFGTTRLQGDYSDRLPVVRRSLYGTIRGLASLQRRACCGHQQHHTNTQYDGQVLTRITLALENGGFRRRRLSRQIRKSGEGSPSPLGGWGKLGS